MIYGEIKELGFYKGISKALDKAIDCILSGEYKNGKTGKNEIDGDIVFFNQLEAPMTKGMEEGFLEGHKKYIDIHIVVDGEERIGYVPNSKVKIKKEYDEVADFEVYEGEVESFYYLNSERFLICFPEEPHMALIKAGDKPQTIKKVIFKILAK